MCSSTVAGRRGSFPADLQSRAKRCKRHCCSRSPPLHQGALAVLLWNYWQRERERESLEVVANYKWTKEASGSTSLADTDKCCTLSCWLFCPGWWCLKLLQVSVQADTSGQTRPVEGWNQVGRLCALVEVRLTVFTAVPLRSCICLYDVLRSAVPVARTHTVRRLEVYCQHTHTCLPVSEWLANKRKGYWKIEGAIMSQIFSSVSISGWPGVDRAWSGLERLSATVTYILHCGSVLKGSFEAKNLMLRKAFVTRTLGGNKILPQTNRSCAPEWIKFNRDRSKAASLNPMKYVCFFGLMATHLSE